MRPDAQIACAGTTWEPTGAREDRIRRGAVGYRIVFECQKCGRVRHDIVNLRGDLIARWYDPDTMYIEAGYRLLINDYRLGILEQFGVISRTSSVTNIKRGRRRAS